MKSSTWAWIAGLGALAAAGVGVFFYEKKKAAALPSSTIPAPTLTHLAANSSLQAGKSYVCAGLVPPGLAVSSANLATELAPVGWSNVDVLWFGPTGEHNDSSAIANQPAVAVHRIASQTIFAGTWSGVDGTPLPPNVDVWAVS